MADNLQTSAQATSDSKRRKVEVEVTTAGQTRTDRSKGVDTDKAKANYLSAQLRVRLQYAKLKVEHGWQRQTLNEVENLYFRHTHLTRPYPVISPGGRRSGRTLSVHAFASNPSQQENTPSTYGASREQSLAGVAVQIFASASAGAGPSPWQNGTLSGTGSSSSLDSASTPSIPSTPNPDASRVATPLAPHVGFNSVTRYPITRSDSMTTVIMESTPSLYQSAAPASSSKLAAAPSSSSAQSSFREPFDPMEPTEHLDSQLAALRSIITASSMPIPLPPPTPASASASPAPSMSPATAAAVSSSGGLTYDAFWSAHGSATASSYRTLLAAHTARAATPSPLQAHGSAPAVLGPSAAANRGTGPQEGAT